MWDTGEPSAPQEPAGPARAVREWPLVLELALPAARTCRVLREGSRQRSFKTTVVDGLRSQTEHDERRIILVQALGSLPDRTATWLDRPDLPAVTVTLIRRSGQDGVLVADERPAGLVVGHVEVRVDDRWTGQGRVAVGRDGWYLGPLQLPGAVLGYEDPVTVRLQARGVARPASAVLLRAVEIGPYLVGRDEVLARL